MFHLVVLNFYQTNRGKILYKSGKNIDDMDWD